MQVYINDVLCNIIEKTNKGFYADNPDNPFIKCSFHSFTNGEFNLLLSGGNLILKNGCLYSIKNY